MINTCMATLFKGFSTIDKVRNILKEELLDE